MGKTFIEVTRENFEKLNPWNERLKGMEPEKFHIFDGGATALYPTNEVFTVLSEISKWEIFNSHEQYNSYIEVAGNKKFPWLLDARLPRSSGKGVGDFFITQMIDLPFCFGGVIKQRGAIAVAVKAMLAAARYFKHLNISNYIVSHDIGKIDTWVNEYIAFPQQALVNDYRPKDFEILWSHLKEEKPEDVFEKHGYSTRESYNNRVAELMKAFPKNASKGEIIKFLEYAHIINNAVPFDHDFYSKQTIAEKFVVENGNGKNGK